MRILLTLTLLGALWSPLAAQVSAPSDTAPGYPRWFVTGYAGSFAIADDELDGVGMTTDASVLLGARLAYLLTPRWAIEASYGHASLDGTSEGFGEVDGRLHLYHAGLVFLAPDSAVAQVALSAGAGGMHYSYDEFERQGILLQGESWANELLISLGAGLLVNLGRHAGLRVEARDDIQFCSAEEEPIEVTDDFSHCPLDDKVLHNPEFSGGVLLRF
ncbi:MAG TPA: outer membrane beta-barrel protein [Gemmatimonadota bacterium]|nr:outer membrane beta-barrel protein [Gemmatimonadota bacterium]